jgi:hypothetical protein
MPQIDPDKTDDLTTTKVVHNHNALPPDFLLQFFAYEHLPEKLRDVSKPFGVLAWDLVKKLPRNPERTVMLRKLLEAKDCAVRCALAKE